MAQLAEQLICNQQVIGSSPIIGFMEHNSIWMDSRVAKGDGSSLPSEKVRGEAEQALRILVLKKRGKKYRSDSYVKRLEK